MYIANLPRDFTESSIRELLSPHGMVISTRVLRNPDGTSRCVGFARMETKQCCDQIITYYNGKKLDIDGDPLVVKLADSGARRPKHSTSSSGQSSDQVTIDFYTINNCIILGKCILKLAIYPRSLFLSSSRL